MAKWPRRCDNESSMELDVRAGRQGGAQSALQNIKMFHGKLVAQPIDIRTQKQLLEMLGKAGPQ